MKYTEALKKAIKRAKETDEVYYVTHDENDDYDYGDSEDMNEYFYPEEVIETVHPDGSHLDHSDTLNPAWED